MQPLAIRLGISGYRVLVAGVTGYAVFLVIGLGLVPRAVRDLESRAAFGDASRTSERLEQRQSSLVQRFSVLETRQNVRNSPGA